MIETDDGECKTVDARILLAYDVAKFLSNEDSNAFLLPLSCLFSLFLSS